MFGTCVYKIIMVTGLSTNPQSCYLRAKSKSKHMRKLPTILARKNFKRKQRRLRISALERPVGGDMKVLLASYHCSFISTSTISATLLAMDPQISQVL